MSLCSLSRRQLRIYNLQKWQRIINRNIKNGMSAFLQIGQITECICRLVAHVLLPRVPAHLALDVTAPDESALAFLSDIPHSRLVAPTAAQQPATVETEGRPIAHSSSCTRNAESVMKRTKVIKM